MGLLCALVPDGTHDKESRLADGLEDTEQGSDGNKSREGEADSVQAQNGGPGQNVESKVLGNRHTLDDPVSWVFDDKYSKVDTGRQPREL